MRLTTIFVFSAVLAGFMPSPQTAYAQRIEERIQPVPPHNSGDIIDYDYAVSIDRTSKPGTFELKGHFSNYHQAQEYAQKLLEW